MREMERVMSCLRFQRLISLTVGQSDEYGFKDGFKAGKKCQWLKVSVANGLNKKQGCTDISVVIF